MSPIYRRRLLLAAAAATVAVALLSFVSDAAAYSPSSSSDVHHCNAHHHHHHHHHHHEFDGRRKLPEEMAEEEDLAHPEFISDSGHDMDDEPMLPTLGLWMKAMGCSLLVSMASLVCLIIVPVFFIGGSPSKVLVDSLAIFGAGAMLGDAFLHQLPHAFGAEHSHSHDNQIDGFHEHHPAHEHSHSLQDLSVGLAVLSGIVLFLIVEKVVRYVEDYSVNGAFPAQRHHHHKLMVDDGDVSSKVNEDSVHKDEQDTTSKDKRFDVASVNNMSDGTCSESSSLRKRTSSHGSAGYVENDTNNTDNTTTEQKTSLCEAPTHPSNLVFGYLNLFSDGVHNFTDGMALGSAFLLYGSVGGWSRTVFLLAHELPQEIGDFGILVRAGFPVWKALFFNFLSALVALSGTALALLLGKKPGHSSLIEGFTAGGFIYIAVAGVLPEMNNSSSTIKNTAFQLLSLAAGMAVALCISLVE